MSESPVSFDCQRCIASGRRNTRGRECTKWGRDLKEDPVSYVAKVRNQPEIKGSIQSEEELDDAIDQIQTLYQTDDIEVALRRVGKGFCPKSYPISQQSFYFLDLYQKTHGGEQGMELLHLPLAGGALDQPNIFYAAMDVIAAERAQTWRKKFAEIEDKSSGETNTRPHGPRRKSNFTGGSGP